jgi:hypothetical protein
MMTTDRLEMLDRDSWRAFVNAPLSVLMIARSTCPSCSRWTEELRAFLNHDREFADVRFGKLEMDQAGTNAFRRANPWLDTEVDVLPYNVIFSRGEPIKGFPGSGTTRLVNRLRAAREGQAPPPQPEAQA